MPDDKAPAANDYLPSVDKMLKRMRFDAELHGDKNGPDKSFLPSYNYNSSNLKSQYQELSANFLQGQPGIPSTILDQVKSLEGNFKDTVRDVVNSGFKEVNFTTPLAALQTEIAAAKAKPPAEQAPGQDNAALDALSAAIKNIESNGLVNELQQAQRTLKLQNDMNLEAAFANQAMQAGAYKTMSSYYVNGWMNNTNDDRYSDEELGRLKDSGVGISNEAELHNGADGVYSKADSFYKVEKRTDEDGNTSYSATYSNVPKSSNRVAAESLVDIAATLVRFYGNITLVIPVLELAVYAVSMALSRGQSSGPLGPPGTQFRKMLDPDHYSLFDQRKGTKRDEARAEIDLARNRGKEHSMTFNLKSGEKMTGGELEKLSVYIDEMKKRGGYEPGIDGGPGRMTKPKDAMDFRITIGVETKLRQMAANVQPSDETIKMVKQFYKDQNNGDMKGFKVENFKEIILKQIKDLSIAYAPLRGPGQDQKQSSTISPAGNANTSTITPTAGGPTSVISPTTPGATSTITPTALAATSIISPLPSAPPEPPKFNAVEMVARQMAMDKITDHAIDKLYTMIMDPTDTLPETVKNACDALKGLTDKGPEDIAMFTAFELKENIDFALQTLSPEEIVTMEAAGELKNYHEAVATMPKESNGKAKYPESPAIQAALDNAPEKPALGRLGGKLPEPPPAPEGAPAPTAPRMK